MRHIGLLVGILISLHGAASSPVHAQTPVTHPGNAPANTIGSQYNGHLANKCSQLGFDREGGGQISGGQAVGALLAYCNGVAAPGDPSIYIPDNVWDDPMWLVEPGAIDRISAMPDWRDRTIRQRLSRRARRSGQQPTESPSNFSVFVGVRPGLMETDEGGFEHGAEGGLSLSPVLGVNYWLSDDVQVSVAGSHRERGYAVGTSAVWTPSERAFAELKLTYDTTAPAIDRKITRTSTNGGQANSYEPFYGPTATSKPRIESRAVEFQSGYDVQAGLFVVGPRFGIKYRGSQLEAYSESLAYVATNSLPLALSFDAAEVDSLVHTIGIGLGLKSRGRRIFGPQVDLLWAHEYLDVGRTVTARFADDARADPTQFTFRGETRNRDSLRGRLAYGVGVGSRFTFFTTGEANYQGNSFYMSGTVGFRCKL